MKKKNKNRPKSRARKIVHRVLIVILSIIILAIIIVGMKFGTMFYKYAEEAKVAVDGGGYDAFKTSQTSLMYYDDQSIIATISGDKDLYYLDSSHIPYIVKQIFITIEDRKFYSHSGVDYSAIIRAGIALIKNDGEITQGGSTITQQLARNVFLNHEVSIERKLKEMFIARQLEKTYSKEEILEFYINNIYFGNGFYGLEAASKGYFNKDAEELTIAETAFICAIPNNPTMYDPFNNFNAVCARKNRIVEQLLDENVIDNELYDQILSETIMLSPSIKSKNNYVETYVKYCATIALMKTNGFTLRNTFTSDEDEPSYNEEYSKMYSECNARLFTGGYKIYTSINKEMQEELQAIVDDKLSKYTDVDENGIYKLQASATNIDNKTGLVKAIVGGREQDFNGYTLNRAYQSFRQPGSSIKPLITYTPIFERGYTPDTIVEDKREEGEPDNYPAAYEGNITIRRAVEVSKNTIAWRLFDYLTPSTGISYLQRMNFAKLDKRDFVPAMALGGMTYGVSTLEMASAYAAIENDGLYRYPSCISKITDSSGDIIIDNVNEESRIYDENAARMMTDVLKGVLTSGTGKRYQVNNAICAGKTGTTNSAKDVWMCGYSYYYTTTVWVGYDMPAELDASYGKSAAGYIWQAYMQKTHENLEKMEFNEYVKPIEDEKETESGTTVSDSEADGDNTEETTVQDDTLNQDTVEPNTETGYTTNNQEKYTGETPEATYVDETQEEATGEI